MKRQNTTPSYLELMKVRAAAVYALGTFINSVLERSEHANNIDHSVVRNLVNTVSNDMSCLVRKELINAIQWVVLAFEPVFLNVAIKESNNISPVQDNKTPTSLRRTGSKDRLRITDYDSVERMKRVSSSSAINNLGATNACLMGSMNTLSSLGYGSVYMKIWIALCSLETDPHPEIAQMCCTITGHIKSLVKERDFLDSRNSSLNYSSTSLPPSPNRGNYFSGESPPTLHPSGEFPRISRSAISNKNKSINRSIIDEDSEDKNQFCRKPLVSTKFVEWSSKRFARPNKKEKIVTDTECAIYYERDWRFSRNSNIRLEAIEDHRRAVNSRLESLTFHARTVVAPSLIQMHPFDQQIAVAGKDSFAIWDWGTGAKTTVCQNKSSKFLYSKVTALEWVNGHDLAMLMVASDDGSIRLWRPNVGTSRDPVLVSAWQAFREPKYSGVIMTWEQWTQTVITTGDTRVIRFWDAERELKAFDLFTGTDSMVTCIDSTFSSIYHENYHKYNKCEINDDGLMSDSNNVASYHGPRLGMCVIGCADGSVRLFDRRCNPTESRVKLWMEHGGTVLAVQLKDNIIVSGSTEGNVKIYDIRKNDSIHTTQVIQTSDMSCMSIHRTASAYACGSMHQFIGIYNLKGTLINTIRFYEGFMGHRIGPVTCLNYHPHKVTLATGTLDCCVNVYNLEGRR